MSDYPNKIDSSVSLPLIRNNIIEAGADSINKIREAVISIERALGRNPQGSKTSLSDRLSVSLDDQGGLKESALTNLNIISGPVTNSDISSTARISEEKLDLEYSTSYLKSQVLIISSEVDRFAKQISETKAALEVHEKSRSAHDANTIDVSSISVVDTVNSNITTSNNLQDFLSDFVISHVGYKDSATSTKYSHKASQINIDPEDIKGVLSSDLQNAMIELSDKETGSYENIIHNYTGSHYPSRSVVSNRYILDEVIASNIEVSFPSFNADSGLKGSVVTVSNKDEVYLNAGDFVQIGSAKYRIANYSFTTGKKLDYVFAEGFYPQNGQVVSVSFIRKIKDDYNELGLTIVSLKGNSSSLYKDIIQIINPESATIVAEDRPSFFDFATSNSISFTTESGSYTFTYPGTITDTESLSDYLNDYAVLNAIPLIFFSDKKKLGVSNLIIGASTFISIVGSTDSSRLGLGSSSFKSNPRLGRNIVIGRKEYKGLNKLADSVAVSISGNKIISSGDPFYSMGIGKGSSVVLNNKRYIVQETMSDGSLRVDDSFTVSTSTITCYDETLSFDSLYGDVSLSSSISFETSMVSVYLSEEMVLNFEKTFDASIPYSGGKALVGIVPEGSFFKNESISYSIVLDEIDDAIYLYFSGNKEYIKDGEYYRFGDNNFKLSVLFDAELRSMLSTLPSKSLDLEIRFLDSKRNDALIISHLEYEKSIGSINRILSRNISGYVNHEDFSSDLLDRDKSLLSLTHNTRVLSGIEILSVSSLKGVFEVNISDGMILSDGDFITVESQNLVSNITVSEGRRVYVFSNENGVLDMIQAGADCSFPLSISESIPLFILEYFGSKIYHVNISKYHVDHHKYSRNFISVINDGSGNTFSLKDAIYLAKKYKDAFGIDIEEIRLSTGNFNFKYFSEIEDDLTSAWGNGLVIDYPIKIVGMGDGTVISIDAGSESESNRAERFGYIYVIGSLSDGTELTSVPGGSYVSEGNVSFENLKFDRCGVRAINFGPEGAISYSKSKCTFKNINFYSEQTTSIKNAISSNVTTSGNVGIGNIEIDSCVFTDCNVYFNSPYTSIYNLTLKNSEFFSTYSRNIDLIDSNSGTILNGMSDASGKDYSIFIDNNFRGDRYVRITPMLGWSDYRSGKSKSSELYVLNNLTVSGTGNLTGNLISTGTSNSFVDSTLSFSGSPSSTPLEISSMDSNGDAISLGDGTIKGYQRNIFSNYRQFDLTSTTYTYFLFNFPSYTLNTYSDPNTYLFDATHRMNAREDVDDGLILKRINITIPYLAANEEASFLFVAGSPGPGNRVYTYSESAGVPLAPSIDGGTSYATTKSFDISDSYTTTSFNPNLKIDKSGLCFYIGVAKGVSSGSILDFLFKLDLVLEMK